MSNQKNSKELATEITVAAIQRMGLGISISTADNVKSITNAISEVYKAALKAVIEGE